MKFLLLTQITFQPLFAPEATLKERLQHLQPFFDPPLGSVIMVDRAEIREKTDRPLDVRGYIRISPPAKACFILQKSPLLPDQNICQPTDIAFTMSEIQESGSIEWLLLQSPEDAGTPISWQTPYRLVRTLALGQFHTGIYSKIPIARCEAEKTPEQRKVILHLMTGERWVILFPEKDTPLEPEKKIPNLFVRTMTTSSDGRSSALESSSGGEIAGTEEKGSKADSEDYDPHAMLKLRLSGRYKDVEDVGYHFSFDARGSFEMDSARVLVRNAPMGMNGLCRYRYQGAPLDPESGVIECFNTESYDALYLHMTCSAAISPQLN